MFIQNSDASFVSNIPLVYVINLEFCRKSHSLEKCLFFVLWRFISAQP